MIEFVKSEKRQNIIRVQDMKPGQTGVIVGGRRDGTPVLMALKRLVLQELDSNNGWSAPDSTDLQIRLCDFELREKA